MHFLNNNPRVKDIPRVPLQAARCESSAHVSGSARLVNWRRAWRCIGRGGRGVFLSFLFFFFFWVFFFFLLLCILLSLPAFFFHSHERLLFTIRRLRFLSSLSFSTSIKPVQTVTPRPSSFFLRKKSLTRLAPPCPVPSSLANPCKLCVPSQKACSLLAILVCTVYLERMRSPLNSLCFAPVTVIYFIISFVSFPFLPSTFLGSLLLPIYLSFAVLLIF